MLEWMRALLTPVIALLGIYIAYLQYRVHRQKIRSEVYERRAGIYRIVVLTMQRVATGMPKEDRELFTNFFSGTAEAPFLFDSDVLHYLQEIKERLIETSEITMAQQDYGFADRTDRETKLARRRENLEWFRTQIRDGHKIFSRYLKLDMKQTTT